MAFIMKGTNLLVTDAKRLGILEISEECPEEWFENNSKARYSALKVLNYCNPTLNLGLLCETTSMDAVVRKFGDDDYLLPPQSSFQLCNIADFFQSVAEKYDLIVVDPPWINKSVKRKHSYFQLKYDILNDLPIEKITNPGCLIVVWITNSSSTFSFVMNKLFPRCNVICSSIWHWCKVTKKGKFVCSIESPHKKPYESLILGRVAYDCDMTVRPSKEIDSTKLIISVPSSIHSHKPPLIDVLKPYLVPDSRCIELFARSLLPGWKSIGNEVLKLQNVKLFDLVK